MIKRILAILSPSRRYHEHKPIASLMLRLLDLLLVLLPARSGPLPVAPRRILLMNAAYNGDVLMSTSVIPLLRKAFPNAEIGFLGGSWANQVVANHPDLARTHVIDLFRLNRSKIGLHAKLRQQWRTQGQARREIMACKYDLAIDLFTGFPPLSWFAWSCRIPCRIGYMNRGFGALLTIPLSLEVRPGKHETEYHVDLLAPMGITSDRRINHPALAEPADTDCQSLADLLGWPSLASHRYVVIHPGTGEPLREWPDEKWRETVHLLAADGTFDLLFTGHGTRECATLDRILAGVDSRTRCVNLGGKLSWRQLCALFRHASAVVGVESMSGHLASAWQTPTVTLSTGMADPVRWKPANERGRSLHSAPVCLPCNSRRGCESMCCVRGVEPSAVADATRQLAAVHADGAYLG